MAYERIPQRNQQERTVTATMKQTWLDVTITDDCVYISDWTHTMQFIDIKRNERIPDGHKWEQDYWRYQREFTTIAGKTHTYHIRGLGLSREQCKAIAIKYHVAKADGSIRKHRLD